MTETDFGSKGAASLGGKARAKSLTPEERRANASLAAEARWAKDGKVPIPVATHEGAIRINDVSIECAVLANGRRVLTQQTFLEAIGRSPKPKGGQISSSPDGLPPFIAAEALKPFISDDLKQATVPLVYKTSTGGRAYGYDAMLLPMVCEVYLTARDAKATTKQQDHIVRACDLLMRGLARVGIIALVDEATGYQYDRARLALEEILEKFLSEELRRWVRTFPAAYFKELCRLRHVDFRADMKLPPYFGHLTNDIVYRRLAPGVLKELKERSVNKTTGKRTNKLFQWLSEDIGHPKLLQHLGLVIGLMRVSDTYESFKALLDRAAPIYPENPTLFDDASDWQ